MKTPKKSRFGKFNRRYSLLLISFLCVTCVTLLIVNSYAEKAITSSVDTPIIEIIEPSPSIEKVDPTEQTEFFSKENGKALLWYAMVNDSIVFYKTKGKHPVTGQDLKLVTEKIIQEYKKGLEPKKVLAVVDKKKNYKVNEVKILKKEKKPIVEKKIIRESIWNTSLVNAKDRDEVSLFVFDVKDQIDTDLTKRFKEEFEKKSYYITEEVIYSDVMTSEIAVNLQNKNIDYFKGNLVKYTDYICYGKASYRYSQNKYRDDFLDCTMSIEYSIYSSATGEILVSEKDTVIGSDQNKKTAKLRAIEKFIL